MIHPALYLLIGIVIGLIFGWLIWAGDDDVEDLE